MRYVQIRSAAFPNVNLRLDGGNVTQWTPSGGGTVNCQYGAGRWETFNLLEFVDGSIAFESIAFPNRFLRLDGTGITQPTPDGAGTVNAQWGDQSWQHFKPVHNVDGTVELESSHFANVFLRMYAQSLDQYDVKGSGVVNGNYSADDFTKLVLCECATHDMVSQCIVDLAKQFPEEASNLIGNQKQIAMACCAPFKIDAADLARLEAIDYAKSEDDLPEINVSFTSECAEAVAVTAFDVVLFVASLLGINAKRSESARPLIYKEIAPYVNGLKRLIADFREAEGRAAKAVHLFKLFRQIFNFIGLKAIYKQIKGEMRWFDWVKTCVVAGAQIAAWFASEGIAFIAEAVLIITGAITLLQDAIAVVNKCNTTVGEEQLLIT